MFFVFLLSLCIVYAGDVNDTVAFDGEDGVNRFSQYEYDSLLGKGYSLNGGSFSDIQDVVNSADSGDTIFLEGSFKSAGKSISINKKLNIVSSKGAVLDARGLSRIFVIRSDANFLSIKNLVFKNGFSDARGGGIHLNATGVLIEGCSFINCHARNGGAISTPNNATHANNLTVRNSKFQNNHATSTGGAIIYIAKNLLIDSCSFDSNYVDLVEGGYGGGVFQIGWEFIESNCKIINCRFNNNYVVPNGTTKGHAGVGCIRAGVTFSYCNFTNNRAYDSGVISFHDGGFVFNCRFINNHADNRGGVLTFDESDRRIIIQDSFFVNNSANYAGVASFFNCKNAVILQSELGAILFLFMVVRCILLIRMYLLVIVFL